MSRAQKICEGLNQVGGRERLFTQFSVCGNKSRPTTRTKDILEPGVYNVKTDMNGLFFEPHQSATDELLQIRDENYEWVVEEIKDFWEAKSGFKQLGFTHKRGCLLYGKPGTGKSCLIKILAEDVVKDGNIVFLCKNMSTLVEGLKLYREVEPDRKLLVIMEDIDTIISYNEHALLELMDGDSQIDNVLFLGTTNYINRLPERVIRESRFDRRLEIKYPSDKARETYIRHKLKMCENETKTSEIIRKTKGFGFPQIKELLIQTICFKKSVEEAIRMIKAGGNISESKQLTEKQLQARLDAVLNKEKKSTSTISLNESNTKQTGSLHMRLRTRK